MAGRITAGPMTRLRYRWNETADHRLRYDAVLNVLRQRLPVRVLEVGSGPVGLARYWRQGVVGVDPAFASPPIRGLRATVGSATKLPFEPGPFPVVVSIDMLEHLPLEARLAAVSEMVRVCQDVLILACPCGPDARAAEAQLVGEWAGILPDWLAEHQAAGLPDRAELERLLDAAMTATQRKGRLRWESGGSCASWLHFTRPLRTRWRRLLTQPALVATWPWWRRWALTGEPYRQVVIIEFEPVAAAP
ncbi:MAG: methyltransferase domain-containing protein [Candidatus Sericytochromatia bacterium]|nr:methyltransferase domain-containing protein [Candidatus Sericytochromatia bacterium]